MGDDTTIRVSEELADELYARKTRGDSYEDVLWRLIQQVDAADPTDVDRAPSDQEDVDDDRDVEPTADIDEILSRWTPYGESSDQRLAAGRAVLEELQEREKMTKDEILEDVYPHNQVETQSQDSWWRTTARGIGGKDGALALAIEAGAVEWVRTPPHSAEHHHFRWVGEEIE